MQEIQTKPITQNELVTKAAIDYDINTKPLSIKYDDESEAPSIQNQINKIGCHREAISNDSSILPIANPIDRDFRAPSSFHQVYTIILLKGYFLNHN